MKPTAVQLYTDKSLVTPDVANPSGRGTTRRYSERNLMELLVIRELGRKGVTLARLKIIAHILRERLRVELDPAKMTVGRYHLVIFDHDGDDLSVAFGWTRNIEDIVQLDLGRHRSALVLNITGLQLERFWSMPHELEATETVTVRIRKRPRIEVPAKV